MQTRTAFFEQLDTFSRRALAHFGLPQDGSPNGRGPGNWEGGTPDGIIVHFTADPRLESVLRWFCDPTSGDSSHVVVSEVREAWSDAMCTDLPLVRALPVTVVQVRGPDCEAWHATWANRWAYGIELCNIGELRFLTPPGAWTAEVVSWQDDWTRPLPGSANRIKAAGGRFFQAYAPGQVEACAALCAAYADQVGRWGGSILAHRILGHEHVQATHTLGCGGHDKRDPSSILDLDRMRESACGAPEVDQQEPSLGDKGVETPADDAPGMLRSLGYRVRGQTELTASTAIFQRMMGIVADGIVGPRTREALAARLDDRLSRAPA